MENTKLKDVIREEINKVKDKLIETGLPEFKEWLQSLQRIDDVCKNRNRY